MNIYVILIGALLVVLLVAFGRNPMEEKKKAYDAQFSHDRLIGATEKYFSDQQSHYGHGLGQGLHSLFGGGQPSAQPTGAYPSYNVIRNGASGTFPYRNPYQMQRQQNANDYYPPPPPGTPPSPLQQQQEQQQQQSPQWPQE